MHDIDIWQVSMDTWNNIVSKRDKENWEEHGHKEGDRSDAPTIAPTDHIDGDGDCQPEGQGLWTPSGRDQEDEMRRKTFEAQNKS